MLLYLLISTTSLDRLNHFTVDSIMLSDFVINSDNIERITLI